MFSHSFMHPETELQNLHLMVKNCLETQHYFSREEETVHFANWLLQEAAVLQYPRLPHALLCWEIRTNAGNRSCEDGHGFMMRRQVRLNKARSHLGWEPLPYSEIYDEDDTADYSRLLERIGRGPASGKFTVCICVYDIANGSTVTWFCLTCSSSNIHDLRRPGFMTCGKWMIEWRGRGMKE